MADQLSEKVRSFVAVEVPEQVRSRLGEVQDRLRARGYPVRWVRPEGVHLTLKFLGSVDAGLLPEIQAVLADAAAGFVPFGLGIEGFGVFPSFGRPRVLWLGMAGDLQTLVLLQKAVDDGLKPLGFQPENRPFSPHVTLGRVPDDIPADARLKMGRELKEFHVGKLGTWRVQSVHLVRSRLQPSGAVYSSLAEFPLGKSGDAVGGTHED